MRTPSCSAPTPIYSLLTSDQSRPITYRAEHPSQIQSLRDVAPDQRRACSVCCGQLLDECSRLPETPACR